MTYSGSRARTPAVQAWRAAHAEDIRVRAKAWADANRAKMKVYNREWRLRNQYGISPIEYRDMLVGQAGRCLICLRVPSHDLHVDHDHETGAVRGLLCRDCNSMLGLARDDRARLLRAAHYLEVAL